MLSKYAKLALFLSAVSYLFLSCEKAGPLDSQNQEPPSDQDTWDFEANGIPKFVDVNYLDLQYIEKISRFRSSAGHDYSDDYEANRSMKHYLQPINTLNGQPFDWTEVEIRAPISGTAFIIWDEWGQGAGGYQIWIKSAQYPAFNVILFHVALEPAISEGDTIVAGQVLGHHATSATMSDVAVAVWTSEPDRFDDRDYGEKNISFFDIMTDQLFQEYAQYDSIVTRADLIISKDERDQFPGFFDYPDADNWVIINPPE